MHHNDWLHLAPKHDLRRPPLKVLSPQIARKVNQKKGCLKMEISYCIRERVRTAEPLHPPILKSVVQFSSSQAHHERR